MIFTSPSTIPRARRMPSGEAQGGPMPPPAGRPRREPDVGGAGAEQRALKPAPAEAQGVPRGAGAAAGRRTGRPAGIGGVDGALKGGGAGGTRGAGRGKTGTGGGGIEAALAASRSRTTSSADLNNNSDGRLHVRNRPGKAASIRGRSLCRHLPDAGSPPPGRPAPGKRPLGRTPSQSPRHRCSQRCSKQILCPPPRNCAPSAGPAFPCRPCRCVWRVRGCGCSFSGSSWG